MKKKLMVLLILVVCVSLSMGCAATPTKTTSSAASTAEVTSAITTESSGSTASNSEEPIRIGLLSYYTGSMADNGKYIDAAVEMASEEINAAGGVLGRPIELVIEDGGEDQQSTINATMKILGQGGISALLGSFKSTDIMASSDIVKEYKIPYIACGSAAGLVTEENPYFHIPRMTDDQISKLAAKFVVEELGMKKPAMLYMNNASGAGFAERFKADLKEMYGYDIAVDISYDVTTEKNFSPYVTQILNSDADGVVASGYMTDAGLVMRALYDNGNTLPCFSGNSAYADAIALDIAKEAANGWYTIADWSYMTPIERGIQFETAYEKYAGREANLTAAVMYDAIYLTVEAIRLANSAEPADVNEALRKIKDFDGALTSYTADGFNSMAQSLLQVHIEDQTPKIVGVIERAK